MESQDNRNTANKCEFKRFINSIINSINGLKASYKEERSMILHLVISILVILVDRFKSVREFIPLKHL